MFNYPSHLEQYQFWWTKASGESFLWVQSLKYMLGQHLGIKTEFPWGSLILLSAAKQRLLNYCALVETSVIRPSQPVKAAQVV